MRVTRVRGKRVVRAQMSTRQLLQVRRSEHVTPAQRDKALQKLARSIKLREGQAKKFGGGNVGHLHMLGMLKVGPRRRSLTEF